MQLIYLLVEESMYMPEVGDTIKKRRVYTFGSIERCNKYLDTLQKLEEETNRIVTEDEIRLDDGRLDTSFIVRAGAFLGIFGINHKTVCKLIQM